MADDREPGGVTREIGSDFEDPGSEVLTEPVRDPPWVEAATGTSTVTYVESGRQALALVATHLRERCAGLVHVPAYYCDSMVEPFIRAGWTVRAVGIDDRLELDRDAVLKVRAGALLHTPYFGRTASRALEAALREVRGRGVVVVTDESHRLLLGPQSESDVRVASLRKTLPVPDGGYVTGLRVDPPPQPSGPSPASVRSRAMRLKRAYVSGTTSDRTFREQFLAAEALTEARTRPVAMSRRTMDLVGRLDYTRLRRIRRENAQALTEALDGVQGVRVLNPPDERCLPSHLVIDTPRARELRDWLAARGVYCPIHWPPPSTVVEGVTTWPDHFLSLPVDHRYDLVDMAHVHHLIETFSGGESPT